MVMLNGYIRLITLQFSFSNPDAIPVMKRLDRETQEELAERKSHSSGILVIEPTEKCSLVEFLGELETAGYEMVDAFYKERIDPKDPRGKRTYHMVRFLFAHHEFMGLSDEFKKVRDNMRTALSEMCRVAMWRVRSFSNPFYNNGKEIPDQCAVSINLEARQPLFRPDGQPIMVWQKDENGERIGDTPILLKADYCLQIMGDAICLIKA